RGDENYQITSSDIPNTAIVPEADVTQSAGVVYQRGGRQHIRFSADWFETRKSGELDYLGAQDVIDYESYLPGRVIRAPASPGDSYGVGPIEYVLTGNINLAWRRSENWNFAFDYGIKDILGGNLDFYARYVYFQRYDVEVVPHAPVVDELRDPDTASLDLVPHRINIGGGWQNHRFGFGVEERYFSSRVIPASQQALQGSNHIDAYDPVDAYIKGNLAFWDRTTARKPRLTAELRVNNLLNRPLPKFPTDPSGTGVEAYGDWRGQVYSFSFILSY
ncbi:MAG TPA: hypothetical protein VFE31_10725, partial [Opitutaceae bacterium]|nr:hypothetical protein [Opitutaceae bacterium]